MQLKHWERPAEHPVLHSGQAHVWMIGTDVSADDVARHLTVLEGTEQRRAERFRHEAGRSSYVVARSALRVLLGRYLGMNAALVPLHRTSSGKLRLGPVLDASLRFSVAHSGGVALLSFAHVEVGVDVERMRPVSRADRIIARVFSTATRVRLGSVPEADRQSAFFAAWTQREALVKAVGGAMMVTHDPLDFDWPPVETTRYVDEVTGAGERRRWTVSALPQPAGYAAAFVAAGEVHGLQLLRYSERPGVSVDD